MEFTSSAAMYIGADTHKNYGSHGEGGKKSICPQQKLQFKFEIITWKTCH